MTLNMKLNAMSPLGTVLVQLYQELVIPASQGSAGA